MLLLTNTWTKPLSIPYGNSSILVPVWWTTYITPEQLQYLQDECPWAVYTAEVPAPSATPVTTVDYTWISVEWALTDSTWALFWIEKTIKWDGVESSQYIDIAWATYVPSWTIRVANNDWEFITGSKCYTNWTDDFAIVTAINKSAPVDIASIVYYVNQTTWIVLSAQPTPWSPCPVDTTTNDLLQQIADNTALSNTNEASLIAELVTTRTDLGVKIDAVKTEVTTQWTAIIAKLEELKLSNIAESDETQLKIDATNALITTTNTKLDSLITNTTNANTKLDTIITELTDQWITLDTMSTTLTDIKALATSIDTTTQAILAERDVEEQATAPSQFHIWTTNYYSREIRLYDSETNALISVTPQYSADGKVWTTTAPIGTALIGWYIAPASTNTITWGSLWIIAWSNLWSQPAFSGASDWIDTTIIPWSLQSITITAQWVTDWFTVWSTPNQVWVDCPDGTTAVLFDWQVVTYQVQKDTDSSLRREYTIQASGNAYANIIYSFI